MAVEFPHSNLSEQAPFANQGDLPNPNSTYFLKPPVTILCFF